MMASSPAEVKDERIRRMRAKNLQGTLELIADDAVYFWSSGAAMFGKDAIAAGLADNFSSIDNDTYHVDDLTWLVESHDAAACVFRTLSGPPGAGRRSRPPTGAWTGFLASSDEPVWTFPRCRHGGCETWAIRTRGGY